MPLSTHKPNTTIVHTMTVRDIVDKNKVFPSKDGNRKKFIINFVDNDYAAEYCPLVDVGFDERIQAGQPMTFKIIHRKDFGDEIEPVEKAVAAIINKDAGESRIMNVNSHPATIAIRCATDVLTAKINAGIDAEEISISNMLDDATLIHKWLIKEVQDGPQ